MLLKTGCGGGGYEKNIRGIFIDFLSSYALKLTIHAIGIKNIPVFPIHEMREEGGGNGEGRDL